jgi:predicted membrane-bound spermidine synthase
MSLIHKLFLIVFLEGYVVLSVELLAIRQMLPYVGSGADTTSILIAAVLVPLALGYYTGGNFQSRFGRKKYSIRNRLLRNLAISSLFLLVGLSYGFINLFSQYSYWELNISSHLYLTAIYSLFFLAPPIYLLGQTVPLVSHYLPKQKFAEGAGKILFFSTLGSFAGAVFSTLVLMAFLGVHYTVSITIACLLILSLMIVKSHPNKFVFIIALVFLVSIFMNSKTAMSTFSIVHDNEYSLVKVSEHEYKNSKTSEVKKIKKMSVNHNHSSAIVFDEEINDYRTNFLHLKIMEDKYIYAYQGSEPRDVLVLGAAGFTIGYADKFNNYTFVDIDKDLKDTAEKHFFEEKMSPNKTFMPMPARAFLSQTKNKYDVVIIDLFRGPSHSPYHLVTVEFFNQVKNVIKPNGIMTANLVVSPDFSDDYSVVMDNTIRSVFKNINRTNVFDFNTWREQNLASNVLYTYFASGAKTNRIYTDNQTRQIYDKGRRSK